MQGTLGKQDEGSTSTDTDVQFDAITSNESATIRKHVDATYARSEPTSWRNQLERVTKRQFAQTCFFSTVLTSIIT